MPPATDCDADARERRTAAGRREPPAAAGWAARLALRFEAGEPGTRLARNRHAGPLRLLEGARQRRRPAARGGHRPSARRTRRRRQPGDRTRARSRCAGARHDARPAEVVSQRDASQRRAPGIALQADACLEWLPQPAILFDRRACAAGAGDRRRSDRRLRGLGGAGAGQGGDGRAPRDAGTSTRRCRYRSAGGLLWQERLHAGAADRLFDSPLGWGGRRIAASVWCCAPALAADRLRDLRDCWRSPARRRRAPTPAVRAASRGGATIAADGLLLAKLLADDSEQLMSAVPASCGGRHGFRSKATRERRRGSGVPEPASNAFRPHNAPDHRRRRPP